MKKFEPINKMEFFRGEKEREWIEKLKRISEKIAKSETEALLDLSCRIKMQAFEGIYSPEEIKKDENYVKEMEKKFKQEQIEKNGQPLEEELARTGEKLEVLKTIIFYKFLGKQFIICRSSRFDDIENGIDNLILEKKTGNLVCALDEVEFPKIEEKKAAVLKKNQKGGGRLKYGLSIEEGRIKLTERKNLPIFYLFLPENQIKKGIEELDEDLLEKSGYEKQLFECFKAEMNAQIERLKLEGERLNFELKNKLEFFKEIIS